MGSLSFLITQWALSSGLSGKGNILDQRKETQNFRCSQEGEQGVLSVIQASSWHDSHISQKGRLQRASTAWHPDSVLLRSGAISTAIASFQPFLMVTHLLMRQTDVHLAPSVFQALCSALGNATMSKLSILLPKGNSQSSRRHDLISHRNATVVVREYRNTEGTQSNVFVFYWCVLYYNKFSVLKQHSGVISWFCSSEAQVVCLDSLLRVSQGQNQHVGQPRLLSGSGEESASRII